MRDIKRKHKGNKTKRNYMGNHLVYRTVQAPSNLDLNISNDLDGIITAGNAEQGLTTPNFEGGTTETHLCL